MSNEAKECVREVLESYAKVHFFWTLLKYTYIQKSAPLTSVQPYECSPTDKGSRQADQVAEPQKPMMTSPQG